MSNRTSYERATLKYDPEHECALVEALTETIFEVSRISDCDTIILRTAELASALTTILATALALSPSATRSPIALRHTLDELGKRLRRKIAHAASGPDFREFKDRIFHNDREGGNA
jgi:hypothetical protein